MYNDSTQCVQMKNNQKTRLPRKMKKAMAGLLIGSDGSVFFNSRFRLRRYPRTKWVVRAERELRRLWREACDKKRRLRLLESRIVEVEYAVNVMKRFLGDKQVRTEVWREN